MKKHATPYSCHFVFILLLFSFVSINAQEDSQILDSYEEYTEAAREVVYLHLNKSNYIKGEDIAFTAYVLDKKDKKPSLLTTNLYVSIADKDDTILKQKLIKVVDGVASNTFEIDSLFKSGHYKIKAYTNWMLNFNEKNYFSESIRVIDADTEDYADEKRIDNKIDAQFLPESGHLLNGVVNVVGVVIKDQLGFGIPFAKGEVVDKNNELLTSFETNQFGIGKFQLLPELGNQYKVNVKNTNKDFTFNINQNIEKEGIIIALKSLNSKLFVSLITNKKTLETVKNKRHTLMIHNGDQFDIMDIYFTDSTEITKAIEYGNTASGINTLTLFNDSDQPIAERLFFNYEGLSILKTDTITLNKTKDSVTLNLNFKGINADTFNSLSISVLPEETKSYTSHNNIMSYVFLEPYVNGTIEQSKYYFTDIDAKKKYELDNLLITQGWSSYNWYHIFNTEPETPYAFEQGITIKANLTAKDKNNGKEINFLMHAIGNDAPRVFNVNDTHNSFLIENTFPEEATTIKISKMTETNGLLPATLYLQFFPNIIPPLNDKNSLLTPKPDYKLLESLSRYRSNFMFNNANNVQKLDEVTIKSNVNNNKQRLEKLNNSVGGNITVFDEQDKKTFTTLTNFLISKGLFVDDSTSGLDVRSTYSPDTPMLIYLDDMLLYDTSILNRYSIENIDYIEINKTGIGQGLRGESGVIKIYLNEISTTTNYDKSTMKEFKLPLAFSPEKKYYVPKYRNTGDSFYKSYGVVDWKPQLKIDKNGNASLKFERPRLPITLFIEGIINDGSFIFEEKTVPMN
ncbi:hypothetical protein [Winogradskyella thalassocola]|uniref:TonB-dependent Receptor Plug Domain n=1 Tax=Winogradskyella thalassocola TaxID=262004 RepID=A0A1G7W954_9FLAO|nr:hypothetical protein [Winogradskyella thalassocola]SDG68468.1 hypothetical protein SAMN04489796_101291 [Winogradskyella thalassocola]